MSTVHFLRMDVLTDHIEVVTVNATSTDEAADAAVAATCSDHLSVVTVLAAAPASRGRYRVVLRVRMVALRHQPDGAVLAAVRRLRELPHREVPTVPAD